MYSPGTRVTVTAVNPGQNRALIGRTGTVDHVANGLIHVRGLSLPIIKLAVPETAFRPNQLQQA